ncbi:PD-(D/E)XK motif protein [Alkalicoccus daliensis]|uniref:Putative PD-(D/E)XK family member n=1 Tax=Alkalicoccus daliensis TaxID=745820 RepID=A0A1H0E9V2_9BACI|nr:PD-(D/E)XK motif protein [Alkalicoccus daliensis]SDN79088.1 Putative PD-(D/E)XK family member [Alkalicoccus daliensis]
MSLLQKIQNTFANIQTDRAQFMDDQNTCLFLLGNGSYGAALRYNGDVVNESYANIRLHTSYLPFADIHGQWLVLSSTVYSLRNEFALICADFIQSKAGEIAEPFQWWGKWKNLMGNAVVNKSPHSLIGEMKVVEHLLKQNKEVTWEPSEYSSTDVKTAEHSYEVKSSTVRFDQRITINSQFQFEQPDYLIFCRFEKTNRGESINSMVEKLHVLGMDRDIINLELNRIGFQEGSSTRNINYELIENRKYDMNQELPGRELQEFIQSYNDPHVIKISFDIDLTGITYEPFKISEN